MAYVTSASTKGGRNGRAMLDNGALALAMAAPKEIGGAGDVDNPDQLFALGYSSCYGQAILLIEKKYGLDGQAARVTCAVTLDQKDGGFGLAVELKVSIPGADKEKLQQLVEEAHTVLPVLEGNQRQYSGQADRRLRFRTSRREFHGYTRQPDRTHHASHRRRRRRAVRRTSAGHSQRVRNPERRQQPGGGGGVVCCAGPG